MIPLPYLATTDLGAQVAAYEGADSNVFQTTAADGTVQRHSSLFTGVEAGALVRSRGLLETYQLRALGRFQVYAPNADSTVREDAFGGLIATASYTLTPRTRLALSALGSVGSVQASRGTDAAAVAFDPFSTRRVGWATSESATLARDLDPTVIFSQSLGVNFGGTISQDDPTVVGRVGEPVEYLRLSTLTDLSRQLDARTRVHGAIELERSRTFYVLDRSGATPRNLGPIDSAAATATIGVTHRVTVPLTVSANGGATLALPILRGPVYLLPAVSAELLYVQPAWSLRASTGFLFGTPDPTFGPGGTASAGLAFIGRPGGSESDFSVLAGANAARTFLILGPNDGGDITTTNASVALRYNIAGWLGAIVGYDVRMTTFNGRSSATSASFVRHLAFVGLSGAWTNERNATPIATLAAPTGL